jgi:energy-coupling factor transport system substrate-specific component
VTKWRSPLLTLLSLAALAVFSWPLLADATALEQSLAGVLAVVAAIVIAIATLVVFDGELIGPKQLALLGILAALGAALRVATGGTGGFELVFLVVIIAGAAMGPKFGFLLGAMTILVSSIFFGGFGPWTAFQLFATAWVGAGAGLVSRRFGRWRMAALALYAVVSSYLFGLVMNLWFWPFAVGPTTSISYVAGAGIAENLTSFLTYSLLSSTLTWDTVRAISVASALIIFGRPLIRTLERAKL